MSQPPRGGMDWGHLEKFLGEQIPFLPKGFLHNRMSQNGAWIGDYVQDILKRSFAQDKGGDDNNQEESGAAGGPEASVQNAVSPEHEGARGDLDCEVRVFETHQSVIVRVKVPEGIHQKNLKAYASQNEVRLEQEPMRRKRYVKLPCAVDASAVRAICKNRILELRLPKVEEMELFQEIRVRYL